MPKAFPTHPCSYEAQEFKRKEARVRRTPIRLPGVFNTRSV